LWTLSAGQMLSAGHPVYFSANYNHSETGALVKRGAVQVNKPKVQTPVSRIFDLVGRKLKLKSQNHGALRESIIATKPGLIIISQGNNVAGREVMACCISLKVPFVTVTQLVTEFLWSYADDKVLKDLRNLYAASLKNFFVSQNNMRLNNLMLSQTLSNAEVIFNPYNAVRDFENTYPDDSMYHAAIVGRLECMHKGIDLLLRVICAEKWRQRNLEFTFYGDGPHREWISDFVANNNLLNVRLAGHFNNVKEIWKGNHILILPSRMEGQSVALVEAMYCKRPAIVTNVGGAAELVTNGVNGFIAAHASMDSLDSAMETAWEQRHRWRDLGIAAAATLRSAYPEDPVAYFNNKIKELLG
jgi:glycosyltransferase involved in cell wall biosynthesis